MVPSTVCRYIVCDSPLPEWFVVYETIRELISRIFPFFLVAFLNARILVTYKNTKKDRMERLANSQKKFVYEKSEKVRVRQSLTSLRKGYLGGEKTVYPAVCYNYHLLSVYNSRSSIDDSRGRLQIQQCILSGVYSVFHCLSLRANFDSKVSASIEQILSQKSCILVNESSILWKVDLKYTRI